jgi:hypothetical protein
MTAYDSRRRALPCIDAGPRRWRFNHVFCVLLFVLSLVQRSTRGQGHAKKRLRQPDRREPAAHFVRMRLQQNRPGRAIGLR